MSGLSDVQIMGVTVIIGSVFFFIVGCVAWFIRDRRDAQTVPLTDLLDNSAGGDNLAWTDPIVLAGPDFYDGPCCIDCDLPGEYLLAFAMSSSGAPIEQAYCEEHAEFAMSDEAEWWS